MIDVTPLFRFMARATSGHSGYDRTIRDHVADASRAFRGGDFYGFTYWAHRALTIHELAEAGVRYNWSSESYDEARWKALVHVAFFSTKHEDTDVWAANGARQSAAVAAIKRDLQRVAV